MSPADILAHAIRRAHSAREIPIAIKQTETVVPVPVKVVEKPRPVPVPLAVEVNVQEPELPRYPSVALIAEIVAQFYGLTILDLASERRTKNIIRPRHIVCYLGRTLTPRSYPQIGKVLGRRDHTTVMHGYRKIEALLATDDGLRADIELIKQKLGSARPSPEPSAPAVTQAAGATLQGDA